MESNEISMCSTCPWPVVRASYHCPFYMMATWFFFFFCVCVLDLFLIFEQHCRLGRHNNATSYKAGNFCLFTALPQNLHFYLLQNIRTKNLIVYYYSLHLRGFIPFDRYSVSTLRQASTEFKLQKDLTRGKTKRRERWREDSCQCHYT